MLRHQRSRSLVRAIIAAPIAASILFLSAGVAAAADPVQYSVDVFNCAVYDGDGNSVDPTAVPAGVELILFEGWFATTRGQTVSFANNVTWVLTVNDQAVDVRPALTGVINLGFTWADIFFVSAGTIAAGQTITTHYDNVIKSASYDGFVHWRKGSLFDGGKDCSFMSPAPAS